MTRVPLQRYVNKSHTQCRYVTLPEMHAFIGLIYYRGMLQLNNSSLYRLFKSTDSVPMFSATLSKARWVWSLSAICPLSLFHTVL